MQKWEEDSRKWLKENEKAYKATFYRDGIFNPNRWFNNDIRPLFILKEVHEAKDLCLEEKRINFVEMKEEDDFDPWDGKTVMWRRLGTLAKGVLYFNNYHGEVLEYQLFPNNEQGLAEHRETLENIAIMNLKKYPGGSNTGHDKSRQTIDFTVHAENYADFLRKQIEIMDPTIIICCGKNIVKSCLEKYEIVIDNSIPVIDTYHPSNAGLGFYWNTFDEIKKLNS